MYREDQIAYETQTHWVLEAKPGYFEVYKTGLTHSTRCARVGPFDEPDRARLRAIEECDRRTAEALAQAEPSASGGRPRG
jgi:hypothetical protein